MHLRLRRRRSDGGLTNDFGGATLEARVKDDVVASLRARAKPWARGNRFEDFAVW
jgi:hypothetical protein